MPQNPWIDYRPVTQDLGNGITGHQIMLFYCWLIRLPNGEFVGWYPGRWQWSWNFQRWGQWWERWRWYRLRDPHWQTVGEHEFDGYVHGDGILMGKWRWIPQGREPWDLDVPGLEPQTS